MILAIDIGNSTIGCGVFNHDELLATWHVTLSDTKKPDADYSAALSRELARARIGLDQIRGAILCSVVPALTTLIGKVTENAIRIPPHVVTTLMDAGLTLKYTNPPELGVDRFVTAARAYDLYHCDVIVVDFGTATTFSVVNQQGTYLGGAIAPGIGLSADALANKTAQLPRADLVPPSSAIGRDTVSGIQSGIIFGHAASVDGMITRFQAELGRTAKVIGTGGYASTIVPYSHAIHEVRPYLALEGLAWLYRRLELKEK